MNEVYDDWTVSCQYNQSTNKRVCQASQELQQQKSRQRVLLISFGPADDAGAHMTIVAPFGLLLAEGLDVKLDEQQLIRGSFRTCLPAGCIVELDLPETALTTLLSAEKATVQGVAVGDQAFRTEVSLKGLATSLKRLSDLVSK
ncbi:invasion associated locus B family protein [Mesorhizobium sp. M0152]|uniref:invasion associated locus B family protein n=1 Tax=Mesorhizobium sp. M0152 TaxID=2956898 RepID=UPI003337FA9E